MVIFYTDQTIFNTKRLSFPKLWKNDSNHWKISMSDAKNKTCLFDGPNGVLKVQGIDKTDMLKPHVWRQNRQGNATKPIADIHYQTTKVTSKSQVTQNLQNDETMHHTGREFLFFLVQSHTRVVGSIFSTAPNDDLDAIPKMKWKGKNVIWEPINMFFPWRILEFPFW